jgi:hypothetical protein
MVRNKSSGTLIDVNGVGLSKGMFVVRFKSVEEATTFLERHHSSPLLIDGSLFMADYGIDKRDDDWRCSSCRGTNFSWRQTCHACQRPRVSPSAHPVNNGDVDVPAESVNGSSDICPSPTKFLLLRGLPVSASGKHV